MSDYRNKYLKTTYLQIGILSIFAIVGILLQHYMNEYVNVANGFGWDGEIYGRITLEFYNEIFIKGIDGYHIQRILPSAIVSTFMFILRIPFTTNNVIISFTIYNTILVLGACFIWGKIACELKLTPKGFWLGFIGLFINFFILKLTYFYPVLTDITAFFFGIFIIYFYLKNNNLGIFIIMILGSFTWASFFIISMPLFMFKFQKEQKLVLEKKYNIYITIIGCVLWLSIALLLIYRFINGHIEGFGEGINTIMANRFETYCLPLGVISVIIFLYYVIKNILNYDYIFNINKFFKSINIKTFFTGIISFVLIQYLFSFYMSTYEIPGNLSMVGAVVSIFNRGIRLPFLFGISEVAYYGPIMLITLLFWKKFCSIINEYGYGLLLYIIAGILLSLNSESRFVVNIFPAVIIFTAKAIDELNFKKHYYYLLFVISVFYSKIWLLINANPTPAADVSDYLGLTQTAWQKYFMNIGPWMSDKMYLLQMPVVIITSVLMWIIIKRHYESENI